MKIEDKIYVAGHEGLVGSAIIKKLREKGFQNLIVKTRDELDLLDQKAVHEFFKSEKIEYVFVAAAKVGGIYANSTYPADFIYQNLTIASNVIHASHQFAVKKLLYLGSSCIYPKHCPQPMKEEYLMSGPLEETNEAYAIAKIAGLKMCQHFYKQYGKCFISAMPTNLYGPNDSYHTENSHVLPALIRKFHEAKLSKLKNVEIWGSGNALREFLYSEDLAEALLLMMQKYHGSNFLNVGSGQEISIGELAKLVQAIVGYQGELVFNHSLPDGMPRKLLDISKITKLGWAAQTKLEIGIRQAYEWALKNEVLNLNVAKIQDSSYKSNQPTYKDRQTG